MRWKKTITMVEAHAEGEVGRIVTGGVVDLPGRSMLDKMNYINQVDDSLRRFLVYEPRGYAQMSTNLIFPPQHPDADIGLLILQGDKAHSMSGSNCICLITALLETGTIEMKEPRTVVVIDTPSGLVRARAACRDGKCERVTLEMTASYADQIDAVVDVEGCGEVRVDIAFGGVFYALVDPSQFALKIKPQHARHLVDIGSRVHRAVNQQLKVSHPYLAGIEGVSYVMFVGHDSDGTLKGATVLPPGRIDRSPCGTGCSARLAVMAARGQIDPGQKLTARSIIDSEFQLEVTGMEKKGRRIYVMPSVTGRGWIHGIHHIGLDPTDPYPYGYMVADCWGDATDLVNEIPTHV